MTPLPVVPKALLSLPAEQPPTPPRGSTCSRPGCGMNAVHRHHAVGRSAQRAHFGKVEDWVLIDGKLALVLVDLCGLCHDRLESQWGGVKSRLRWGGGWVWYDRASRRDLELGQGILWHDKDTDTTWKLRGFCEGVYTIGDRTD